MREVLSARFCCKRASTSDGSISLCFNSVTEQGSTVPTRWYRASAAAAATRCRRGATARACFRLWITKDQEGGFTHAEFPAVRSGTVLTRSIGTVASGRTSPACPRCQRAPCDVGVAVIRPHLVPPHFREDDSCFHQLRVLGYLFPSRQRQPSLVHDMEREFHPAVARSAED